MIVHSYTPAADLFREVSDVQKLILDFMTAPDVHVKHWPTYYRLYIDVDELVWAVRMAARCFGGRWIEPDCPADRDLIDVVNSCIRRLAACQQRIVDRLGHIEREDLIVFSDASILHRLRCHFRPKSAWYLEFHEKYDAGKISDDGSTLTRTILLIDQDPTYRTPDLYEKDLVRQQVFDLSTNDARAALAHTADQLGTQIGNVYTLLGDYFLGHCTTKDLLHPSSY